MKKRALWREAFIWTLVIFIICSFYTVLRYHIFKDVSWHQFPVYIFNKIISFTAIFCLSIPYALGPMSRFWPYLKKQLGVRKPLGLIGFFFALLHILISFPIITPTYFQHFFVDNRLNLAGGFTILFGAMAAIVFAIVAISSLPSVAEAMEQKEWLMLQKTGLLGLMLLVGHVFARGIQSWSEVQHWPGTLPPISLLAFVIAIIPLLVRVFFVEKQDTC